MSGNRAATRGFTLIELLVVVTILGILLAIVAPRYWHGVEKTREAVLAENLHAMRDAIDKFYADRGHYPGALEDLVEYRYLRAIPMDPYTERNDTWMVTAPESENNGAVYDVRSSARGYTRSGRPLDQF